MKLPLFLEPVVAGFPSPAQDYIDRKLDLNELCVQHPAATFFVRVEGESMMGAGIAPDDLLVVDRALTATEGDIVLAAVHGELTVKRLQLQPCLALLAENPLFEPIQPAEPESLEIQGVVTHCIKRLR